MFRSILACVTSDHEGIHLSSVSTQDKFFPAQLVSNHCRGMDRRTLPRIETDGCAEWTQQGNDQVNHLNGTISFLTGLWKHPVYAPNSATDHLNLYSWMNCLYGAFFPPFCLVWILSVNLKICLSANVLCVWLVSGVYEFVVVKKSNIKHHWTRSKPKYCRIK